MENLEDLFVLILHVNEAHFLTLVLANELSELLAVLNLVQALDELVGEGLDPLNIALLDLQERLSNLALPLGDHVNVWRVLVDRLRCVRLD